MAHHPHTTPATIRAWHEHPLYPWLRMFASLMLATSSAVGMYAVVVVLPDVQAEFATARQGASLPYTLTMVGFGIGGILMGWLTDRFRVMVPVLVGGACLAGGFALASMANSVAMFAAVSTLIGIGASATFAPLVADISLWFLRRRGIALAIVASGNYLGGAIWPPVTRALADANGWRPTYVIVAIACACATVSLAWLLRPAPPAHQLGAAPVATARPVPIKPGLLQGLLFISGISCCVAMSMPQVHIVALCADLGYGTTRGAQMLAVMLGSGIVSRLLSGWLSDHIGGARTLLIGAVLQATALALFLPNQSLDVLFAASAFFGLVQGGIVPSYAMIVRENFPASQAGTRVSVTIGATLAGMALGGWLSGAIFDWTGSYDAAFMNGIAWNLVTVTIAGLLAFMGGRRVVKGSRNPI